MAYLTIVNSTRVCPPQKDFPELSKVTLQNGDTLFPTRVVRVSVIPNANDSGIAFFDSFGSESFDNSTISARAFAMQGTSPTVYFKNPEDFLHKGNYTLDEFYVGNFTSMMTVVFDEVLEFEDNDGNKLYDPVHDKVIKVITLEDREWDIICYKFDGTFGTFNFSTVLNHGPNATDLFDFSFQAQFSAKSGVTPTYKILTPKSSKIDIKLNKFPFSSTKKNRYLSFGVSILYAESMSSNHTESVVDRPKENYIHTLGASTQQYFMWEDTAHALVDQQLIDIKSSPLYDLNMNNFTGASADMFLKGNTDAKIVAAKRLYFSVGKKPETSMYWDPTVGLGDLPVNMALIYGRLVKIILVSIMGVMTAIVTAVYLGCW
eukprot:CAMPEP_0168536564 /NCGR_PEP_ID=MMETSP0405-20121227/19653_1 /TAXON_ID=498012 /ORGANISM="Trichosphaerium sp, Strain Am-I-7 wt" /LENGTH=374 /DNA_ID=CAMNT_0008564651 /DNA_START=53 /DNA_END=1173 /DNA_ORIENTATION=-